MRITCGTILVNFEKRFRPAYGLFSFEKLCFAASGSIINYYFHSCFFLWPVHYRHILFTPFLREHFLETGESLDATFKRHLGPLVTN